MSSKQSSSKVSNADDESTSESSTSTNVSSFTGTTSKTGSKGTVGTTSKQSESKQKDETFSKGDDEYQPSKKERNETEKSERIGKQTGGTTSESAVSSSKAKAKADDMQRTFRKIMVMRCAERLDAVYPSWVHMGFTELGKYKMCDLNMPACMVSRSGDNRDFVSDTPISEMGNSLAQLTGRGLQLNKVNIGHFIVSPALRCVQTMKSILKGMIGAGRAKEDMPKIKLEPGLFEPVTWYTDGIPNFMAEDELNASLGLDFDKKYKQFWSIEDMKAKGIAESELDHYERLVKVMDHILSQCNDGKDILIIGHATTVDGVTRNLRGVKVVPPEKEVLHELGKDYPHGCMVTIQQNPDNHMWRHCNNPVPPLTCCDFTNKVQLETFCRDPY